jgi:hypothetical protein
MPKVAPLWLSLLALGCAGEGDPTKVASAQTRASGQPVASAAPLASASSAPKVSSTTSAISPGATGPRCREQTAQDFLLRHGQIAKVGASAAERRSIEAARKRAIDYRTRQYGRFPGFGSPADNPHPPRFYAKRTTFAGLPLVVHEKIVPALACVETALERDCAQRPYQPRTASGIRFENTYKDYEISNHVFGIAIDIDSHQNPCCGCVGKWSQDPLCRKKVGSVYERMAMPKCWVEVFERYGFYWLGHDELEDTMHFEFLGDPDRIVE